MTNDEVMRHSSFVIRHLVCERIVTEAELIDQIQAGDKAACAQCVEMHAPAIYRLALRMVGDPEEAEDVMQETFLSAFRAIESFEGRSGLATWLFRIANNVALMRLRKRQPLFVSIDMPTAENDGAEVTPVQLFDWCCLPEDDFATVEAHGELEQAIAELSPALRSVFILRELEGLSTEATAQALELTPANVKVRLHRARLWLRERLAGYFTELAREAAHG